MHILWLKTELLHPLDKGGRIRTYQMLRQLVRDHRVTYLTLDDGCRDADAVERAAEYCTDLVRVPTRMSAKGSTRFYWELARNLASPLPYAVAKYRSPAMEEALLRLIERTSVDLVVCDFLFPAVNVPSPLPVPAALFQHNVEAMIWQRHAAVASHPLRRAYLERQWHRMYAFEKAQCRRFDHVVAVSPEDSAWFAREYGVRNVSHVPTGVDTEYFRPTRGTRSNPNTILFTGSMDWMPNEDAVTYFAEAILPGVQAEVPQATISIVGRNPTPAVLGLTQRHSSVRVTGTVPDVRPYLESAALFVVPLRIGGGTRLKIFEAMAMEKAIVTTSVGAEGLPVRDGEHLLIADTVPAFASAVVKLLRDPSYAAALGQRAGELVRSRFGWDRAAEQFAEICLQTAAPPAQNVQTLVHSR
ncbi:MAG TPA: glycosyltransferase [Gemmatimonadaceae bacterium]|nr:glycosyltransferase [Gemmatimonadaceae bacterium]